MQNEVKRSTEDIQRKKEHIDMLARDSTSLNNEIVKIHDQTNVVERNLSDLRNRHDVMVNDLVNSIRKLEQDN